MTHGLSTLVTTMVLVVPIECSHKEELEQNRIGEVFGRTSTDLLGNTTSVSPEAIVPMTLGENIIMPTVIIGP